MILLPVVGVPFAFDLLSEYECNRSVAIRFVALKVQWADEFGGNITGDGDVICR